MEGVMAEGDGVADRGAAARTQWGRPGPCPKCGGQGYLDHVDLVDRIMYQRCTNFDCRHKWQTAEAELAGQA
jgi:hypothetical protein